MRAEGQWEARVRGGAGRGWETHPGGVLARGGAFSFLTCAEGLKSVGVLAPEVLPAAASGVVLCEVRAASVSIGSRDAGPTPGATTLSSVARMSWSLPTLFKPNCVSSTMQPLQRSPLSTKAASWLVRTARMEDAPSLNEHLCLPFPIDCRSVTYATGHGRAAGPPPTAWGAAARPGPRSRPFRILGRARRVGARRPHLEHDARWELLILAQARQVARCQLHGHRALLAGPASLSFAGPVKLHWCFQVECKRQAGRM